MFYSRNHSLVNLFFTKLIHVIFRLLQTWDVRDENGTFPEELKVSGATNGGFMKQSLIINENYLRADKRYKFYVHVTISNLEITVTYQYEARTNPVPYGGKCFVM